jgi:hypothetical protein
MFSEEHTAQLSLSTMKNKCFPSLLKEEYEVSFFFKFQVNLIWNFVNLKKMDPVRWLRGWWFFRQSLMMTSMPEAHGVEGQLQPCTDLHRLQWHTHAHPSIHANVCHTHREWHSNGLMQQFLKCLVSTSVSSPGESRAGGWSCAARPWLPLGEALPQTLPLA